LVLKKRKILVNESSFSLFEDVDIFEHIEVLLWCNDLVCGDDDVFKLLFSSYGAYFSKGHSTQHNDHKPLPIKFNYVKLLFVQPCALEGAK
jgi:hypothetical protein